VTRNPNPEEHTCPWLTTLALALGAGCAHPQEVAHAERPAPPRPPARIAPRPAPAPAAVAETEPTTAKAGDAIFFDFDSALLRDDARPVLQSVAEILRQRPKSVRVEGNCDEVGTTEYNLALGEQRARAAKEYLVRLGVPAKVIATISYGSQRPRDGGHDEAAHAKNRRDDLVLR
jgi:peptidoglycan-associated lipoprotein